MLRLLIALALLVAFGAFTGASMLAYFEVEEVRLPDVTGLSLAQATEQLRQRELRVRTFPDHVLDEPPDVVTNQSPPPGAVVRRGRVVSVGVNTPSEADRVPSLVGLREADAAAKARDVNLTVHEVVYEHHERPPGTVVEQAPAAGRELASGERLRLVVSRGPEPASIEMPDVTGMRVQDARARLREAGFARVEAIANRVSMQRPGVVGEQSPEAGERVRPGTAVRIGYALEGRDVVQVPPVGGLSVWRAQLALESAGLAVGAVEFVRRPELPEGVVETRPSGVTVAGSPVQLVVNGEPGGANALLDRERRDGGDPRDGIGGDWQRDGSRGASQLEEGARAVPFRFVPDDLGVRSLMEETYELRLVVSDERGERTVLDERVDAGETVSAQVTVYGDEPLLQTYVNDVFFQAWRP